MDKPYKIEDEVNGYSIIKILGQGRYGIAYLGKNQDEEMCVIKQLKIEMLDKIKDKVLYEKLILETLNDSKFPKYLGNFDDGERKGYLLEYKEGQTLEQIVVKHHHRFSREEIYDVASKIIEIMEILHENNIVHRDIRLPNVIVGKNADLSLIDFGLARFIGTKERQTKVDYWYLGDLMLHLFYSSFDGTEGEEKPWFEELDLKYEEVVFLKRLLSLEESFKTLDEIKKELDKIKEIE